MKKIALAFSLLLPLTAFATPKPGEMVMTGPDSAKIQYEDKCANGGNIGDNLNKEEEFMAAMFSNPKSKLGILHAKLVKKLVTTLEAATEFISVQKFRAITYATAVARHPQAFRFSYSLQQVEIRITKLPARS